MQLEEKKKKALLFWVNTYGSSLNLTAAESLQELWRRHVPSLFNCLTTDFNTLVVGLNSLSVYQDVLSYLMSKSGQERFADSLSADRAAEGDELEIAKFLAVLLNEFRIAKNDVITTSVAVLEEKGYDLAITAILNAFDEEETDWWSVMVNRSPCSSFDDISLKFVTPRRSFYQAEEFTGMSVNRTSFVTPRCPSRRLDSNAHTVARCEGSPLMEALNSPKVRELRRDREIRALRKKVNELEDLVEQYDRQISDSNRRIEVFVKEMLDKKNKICELERSYKLSQQSRDELEENVASLNKKIDILQRQNESQKDRLVSYKLTIEKNEEVKMDLTDKLAAKQESISLLERRTRDLRDELDKAVQVKTSLEQEKNNLVRTLDELRKNAESDREQYLAATSECREHYKDEIKKHMDLYSDEMEKNALLQKEHRDLSERHEELQRRYTQDTSLLERTISDLKKSSQEKHEADAKKINDVQAQLGYFQERTRSITQKHAEELRHLESTHLAEGNQKDAQLASARERIKTLEDKLSEHEHSIREYRKEFACLSITKNALEEELTKVAEELKKKEDDLRDATEAIEKSWVEIESLNQKHTEALKTVESLKTTNKELEGLMQEKGEKLVGLQRTYEDLESDLVRTREELMQEKNLFCETKLDLENAVEKLTNELFEANAVKNNALFEVEQLKKALVTKEECLFKKHAEAEVEKTQLSSRISELEEGLTAEQSNRQALEGQLFECHEEIASKNSELSGKACQLEHLKEELEIMQKEEALTKDECEKLLEKDTIRSEQLSELISRTQLIEKAIAISNERSSKLEEENLSLKCLVDLYEKGLLRGSVSEAGDWLSSCREKSEALANESTEITTEILPLFMTNVDEPPSMMETKSLLGSSDAKDFLKMILTKIFKIWKGKNLKGTPKQIIEVPSPYIPKKPVRDVATSMTDLTVISSTQAASMSNLTAVMTGSDFSLATLGFSQGRPSLARSEFSRPSISGLSMNSRKLEDLPTTDRARLLELQKRNERLHPAMRCAYATEVVGYASPSGSENVIKNGTQSTRKKGKKLMERAASYVKKRLPLSESTNSLH